MHSLILLSGPSRRQEKSIFLFWDLITEHLWTLAPTIKTYPYWTKPKVYALVCFFSCGSLLFITSSAVWIHWWLTRECNLSKAMTSVGGMLIRLLSVLVKHFNSNFLRCFMTLGKWRTHVETHTKKLLCLKVPEKYLFLIFFVWPLVASFFRTTKVCLHSVAVVTTPSAA